MTLGILDDKPETLQDYVERMTVQATLLVLALLTAGPYVLMVSISLMGEGWAPVVPPKTIPVDPSLENYVLLFEEFPFGTYITNTLIYATGATLIVLVLDSMAGFAFARLEFFGRDVLFGGILATMMITPVVLMIPTYLLFNQLGLVNTRIGIILPHAVSGFGVFLMRQFILTLPSSLEDAAVMDGCSTMDIYWRIVLPMMKPALATLGVITFILSWNSFLWPLVLARDSQLYPLTVALGFFEGVLHTDWTGLMAATTLTMIPVVILFVSAQQYYVKGLVIGGIKG